MSGVYDWWDVISSGCQFNMTGDDLSLMINAVISVITSDEGLIYKRWADDFQEEDKWGAGGASWSSDVMMMMSDDYHNEKLPQLMPHHMLIWC